MDLPCKKCGYSHFTHRINIIIGNAEAQSHGRPWRWQDLFSQLDTNGDGVLSPQEMAAMQVPSGIWKHEMERYGKQKRRIKMTQVSNYIQLHPITSNYIQLHPITSNYIQLHSLTRFSLFACAKLSPGPNHRKTQRADLCIFVPSCHKMVSCNFDLSAMS